MNFLKNKNFICSILIILLIFIAVFLITRRSNLTENFNAELNTKLIGKEESKKNTGKEEHTMNIPNKEHKMNINLPKEEEKKKLIGGCESTEWGCCPDNHTAKSGPRGLNCHKIAPEEEHHHHVKPEHHHNVEPEHHHHVNLNTIIMLNLNTIIMLNLNMTKQVKNPLLNQRKSKRKFIKKNNLLISML